jgi:signal transduction histidine kinase
MFNLAPKSVVAFIVILVVLIAFSCMLILVILYLYQKKQLTYFKNLEDIKEQQKKEIARSRVEMQEQTIANVSRHIHNNVGQKLLLTKVLLNSLPGIDLQESHTIAKESMETLTNSMSDLRDISRGLSSEVISNNGLVKSLELEADHLKKAKYNARFRMTGDPFFLSDHIDLLLFRIAQEAVSNIIQHSKASEVNIDLSYNANSIKLSVKDNGIGFSKNQYMGGTGLVNMQKRTKLLEGSLQLRNDRGAYVCVEVPVSEEIKVQPPAIPVEINSG